MSPLIFTFPTAIFTQNAQTFASFTIYEGARVTCYSRGYLAALAIRRKGLKRPSGSSEDVLVLGVATFAITGWDRSSPYGNVEGTTTNSCGNAAKGTGFKCGMVWGYLMENVRPPNVLLGSIGESRNPFAPTMIAMAE